MKLTELLCFTFLMESVFSFPQVLISEQDQNPGEMRVNILYSFAETKDPRLCEPDSIIPSDCTGGDIYLTSKGNVIYSFYCFGSDTEYFDFGRYALTDTGVICTFDRRYSYYAGCSDCPDGEVDSAGRNAGRLERIEINTLHLHRLNCEVFDYYFTGYDQKSKYVLSRSRKDFEENFLKRIAGIDILSKL